MFSVLSCLFSVNVIIKLITFCLFVFNKGYSPLSLLQNIELGLKEIALWRILAEYRRNVYHNFKCFQIVSGTT